MSGPAVRPRGDDGAGLGGEGGSRGTCVPLGTLVTQFPAQVCLLPWRRSSTMAGHLSSGHCCVLSGEPSALHPQMSLESVSQGQCYQFPQTRRLDYNTFIVHVVEARGLNSGCRQGFPRLSPSRVIPFSACLQVARSSVCLHLCLL